MLRALKHRISGISSLKKFTLLLCALLILTISVGTSFSYVVTGTPTLINLFLNGMNPDGDLVIQKTVSHPFGDTYTIPEDLIFTFAVDLGEEYAGETVQTTQGEKTADENGVITVAVTPGGRTTVYDIDEGTPVTVTETQIGKGFTPAAVSQDITIQKYQDNLLTFANTYTPEKANASALTVSGVKTLVGREWIEGDSFTFDLSIYQNGAWSSLGTQTITYELVEQPDPEDPEKTVLVPKPDYDKFDFSELIRACVFDVAGTYSFRITEVEGTIGGLTYDKAESKFDILVGDADMDGYLEIQSVTTTTAANTTVENTTVSISFENKYAPVGSTEAFIEILKVLEDASGQNSSPAGYTFELYDEAGTLLATSNPTDANGETSIRLVYEPTDAGKTFTYILKETNAGQTVGALIYDGTEYKIQVSIVDNLDGTVSAYVYDWQEPVVTNQGPAATDPTEGAAEPEETETEATDPTEGAADTTTPTEVTDTQGETQATEAGSNETGDSSVSDGDAADPTEPTGTTDAATTTDATEGAETENTPGQTDGQETSSTETTGDETTETDTVDNTEGTVSSGDATAAEPVNDVPVTATEPPAPAVVIPEGATNTYKATFTNKYDPQDATAAISGEKTLSGRTMKDGEFTFLLYKTDELFTLSEDAQPIGSAVNTAGAFGFDTLTFDKVGTYYYVVAEDASAKLGGVTYDSSRYLVTITVTDENGVLTAKTSITDGFGEEKDISFTNSYQAASVSLPLGGKKTLMGAELKDYTFRFLLHTADENFTASSTVFQTVTCGSTGEFSFEQLTFTKAGTYRYVVTEDATAAVEGMTYDDTAYQITVVVSDPGDGQLVISEFTMNAGGEAVTDILFENTYVKPTDPTDPDESTDPTDPEDPTDPDDPTDPEDPTDPTDPKDPTSPETGDNSNLTLWIVLMVLSFAGIIVTLLTGRRMKAK